MTSLHQRRTHPTPVAGCFACHVSTVQLGAVEKSAESKREAQWSVDLPAYKRLRAQGLQPKSTVGCAALERDATTEYEIVRGKVYSGKDKKNVMDAIDYVQQGTGKSVLEPATTPRIEST